MATPSPRSKAISDLLGAHRELTVIEFEEAQRTVVAATVWLGLAVLTGAAAWLALNVSVVLVLHERLLTALGGVVALNAVLAIVCAWQSRRLMRGPFFELTRRETERDVRVVLGALS